MAFRLGNGRFRKFSLISNLPIFNVRAAGTSADDAEDVGLGEDEDFLAVDFDFGAAVFGDEDFVADLYVEDDVVAVVILAAGAECEHFSFLGFFLGGVRQDDAAGADGFRFEAFDEDALSEWFDVGHVFWYGCCGFWLEKVC